MMSNFQTSLQENTDLFASLNSCLSMQPDENSQPPPFFGAAAERLVVDCEIPEDCLIPGRQVKAESDGSSLPERAEEESRTDGKLPHPMIVITEATAVESDSTDDEVASWNSNDVKRQLASPSSVSQNGEVTSSICAVADRDFPGGGRENVAIKNCSVVVHPLDMSSLKTPSSQCDDVTSTKNCRKTKEAVAFNVDLKQQMAEKIHQICFHNNVKKRNGHREGTRTGEQPYRRITHCDKMLRIKGRKERHERTARAGEKLYRCSRCDKKFETVGHKMKHERIGHPLSARRRPIKHLLEPLDPMTAHEDLEAQRRHLDVCRATARLLRTQAARMTDQAAELERTVAREEQRLKRRTCVEPTVLEPDSSPDDQPRRRPDAVKRAPRKFLGDQATKDCGIPAYCASALPELAALDPAQVKELRRQGARWGQERHKKDKDRNISTCRTYLRKLCSARDDVLC